MFAVLYCKEFSGIFRSGTERIGSEHAYCTRSSSRCFSSRLTFVALLCSALSVRQCSERALPRPGHAAPLRSAPIQSRAVHTIRYDTDAEPILKWAALFESEAEGGGLRGTRSVVRKLCATFGTGMRTDASVEASTFGRVRASYALPCLPSPPSPARLVR